MHEKNARENVSNCATGKETHTMKQFLVPLLAVGMLIAAGVLFRSNRNGKRTEIPEQERHPSVQQAEREHPDAMNEPSPPPVETTTKEEVSRLLCETELAKKYTFPGTPLFVPGMPYSKIALARYASSPAPDSEGAADGILWIDNATGKIVPEPGKAWHPIPDVELIESALSDLNDDSVKAYHMTLRKEIEQVPGLAVVTFREKSSQKTEHGFALAPDFMLRVWINTRTKTVYFGEVGY